MALTYAQIIQLASEDAKVPGFVSQAGMHLNMVLQDLALNYDFDLMQDDSNTITTVGAATPEGPYSLPADYLRHVPDEIRYVINGVPYNLYQKSIASFKQYQTGSGIGQGFPEFFATDVSVPGSPKAYLWPGPNGAYVIEWPYYKAHTYEATPDTSTNIPWFPMSSYLVKETAARLASGNDDDRADKLSGEARMMLKSYLTMKDDNEGYARVVSLDRNVFRNGSTTRGTKSKPW